MRSIQRKIVLVVAVLLLAVACGKGSDDKKKPSNKWDKMDWDKGKWGAVESHSYRISIA